MTSSPELRDAGIVTIGVDADGRETWTLTAMDAALARQMAMDLEGDARGPRRAAHRRRS
jgi:hypothetical protein